MIVVDVLAAASRSSPRLAVVIRSPDGRGQFQIFANLRREPQNKCVEIYWSRHPLLAQRRPCCSFVLYLIFLCGRAVPGWAERCPALTCLSFIDLLLFSLLCSWCQAHFIWLIIGDMLARTQTLRLQSWIGNHLYISLRIAHSEEARWALCVHSRSVLDTWWQWRRQFDTLSTRTGVHSTWGTSENQLAKEIFVLVTENCFDVCVNCHNKAGIRSSSVPLFQG